MTQSLSELADQLVAGHAGGPVIDTVPEHLVPQDVPGIYALQDLVIARLGKVGGWKVAAGVGDPPLCAPIPQSRYFEAGATLDIGKHRLVLAEVEVAVKLAADIAPGADRATVEAAIGSLHPALEMIASPFADRDAMPRNLVLGDLQSNGAVIVGPALDPAIKDELGTLATTLSYDGVPAHSVSQGASWEVTLGAIAWLAGHADSRGMPLRAGQVIITGARALLKLDGATIIEGRLDRWGAVECVLTP